MAPDNEILILQALSDIGQKLDILIDALTEEDTSAPEAWPTLDGESSGGERDQSQPL